MEITPEQVALHVKDWVNLCNPVLSDFTIRNLTHQLQIGRWCLICQNKSQPVVTNVLVQCHIIHLQYHKHRLRLCHICNFLPIMLHVYTCSVVQDCWQCCHHETTTNSFYGPFLIPQWYYNTPTEWVSSFFLVHQHIRGYSVPWRLGRKNNTNQ